MGSGSKPRKNDKVIIARQKPKVGSGGASGGAGRPTDAVCPPSFPLSMAANKNLVVGAHVSLQKEGESVFVYAGAEQVGRLNPVLAKQIGECMSSGFRYDGIVKEKQGDRVHVEFIRNL